MCRCLSGHGSHVGDRTGKCRPVRIVSDIRLLRGVLVTRGLQIPGHGGRECQPVPNGSVAGHRWETKLPGKQTHINGGSRACRAPGRGCVAASHLELRSASAAACAQQERRGRSSSGVSFCTRCITFCIHSVNRAGFYL